MKINEVETLVGITKKNIRFYEAEGLLTPLRNSENGYRDYGEADIEALRRIKLLGNSNILLQSGDRHLDAEAINISEIKIVGRAVRVEIAL